MKHMWSEEEIASQKKDFATLVDSKGNPRFIEANIDKSLWNIEKAELTYAKWSLSGTHLMIVLAGTGNSATISLNQYVLNTFDIPNFIYEKIVALGGGNAVSITNIRLFSTYTAEDTYFLTLQKETKGLSIRSRWNGTLTINGDFRIQFDLLIDSE